MGEQTPYKRKAQIVSTVRVHQGKLDAALVYSNTTCVTVTIRKGNPLADSGDDIENVLPPIVMTSGTIASGTGVIITLIDGKWYVTGVDCDGVS